MKQLRLFCYILFLTSFITFNYLPVSAQGLSEQQVDSLAQQDLKLFRVPGLAVGIIKDGKLIYSKGFGVRSLQSGKPVDKHTLFGIASNTKAFTAAALGLLVDDGKLKWDDKVTRYIPEFKLYDPYATKEMTIRDLLVHRSGLATGSGDLMHDPDSTSFTVKDIIYNLRYLKPVYSFRSKFAYDNNLYLVAGEVIARVSKMSWETFVEQRILHPLNMSESASSYHACEQSNNIIDPHGVINDSVKMISRYTSAKDDAAGGVYSNIEDMSKWLLMLINNGRYGKNTDKQLLSGQVVHELFAPQTIIPVNKSGVYNTHFAAYGLGWFLSDVKGYKLIAHTGQDVGMVSEVLMIPELKLGIIVLTNNESNAISAITDQIMDSYLGIAGTDESAIAINRLNNGEQNTKDLKAKVWGKADSTKLNLPDLKKYTGTYRDKWFGNVSITIRNNQLWFASQKSPQLRGVLHPYQKNNFLIKWQNPEIDADAIVMFGSLKNGNADQITLKSVAAGMGYNFDDLFLERIKH